jgi:Fe-S-cluster formation regulator IscX/YfhJ
MKTPAAFRAACDKFIYLEILQRDSVEEQTTSERKTPKSKAKVAISKNNRALFNLLKSSINDTADEDGWAYLGDLGNLLLKKQPDFDSRNYGFNKLLQLIKSFDSFEIDIRESGKKMGKLVYVKVK